MLFVVGGKGVGVERRVECVVVEFDEGSARVGGAGVVEWVAEQILLELMCAEHVLLLLLNFVLGVFVEHSDHVVAVLLLQKLLAFATIWVRGTYCGGLVLCSSIDLIIIERPRPYLQTAAFIANSLIYVFASIARLLKLWEPGCCKFPTYAPASLAANKAIKPYNKIRCSSAL